MRQARSPGPARGVLTAAPARATDRREHARALPDDPVLAEHVAHFWWVAWDTGAPATVVTLPHPTVHVVVDDRRGAHVAGVPTGAFRARLPRRGRVFGVKFRPAVFHAWLGGSVAAIADARLPIARCFGAAAGAYVRAIRAAPDFAACRAIAEAFFAPRAPALAAETRDLRDLVERMAADPAIVRVDQAAALAGLPVRTLQRRFAERVGVSVKWVVQRYRLHEAADLLARGTLTLAEIAARAGYFDQAHFARDFRRVVGVPPSHYLEPRARRAPGRAGSRG